MIGRRLGRFTILSKLGQGGMASVWLAQDELLGRRVALKTLEPRLTDSAKVRRRFMHEAQAAAALDHPGIVAVHDTGESDGIAFIALGLVEGTTVSESVAGRLMPIGEAVRVVTAAAEALDHAHRHGVVHRDVTGRNIMIGRDGRVYVLDFGLALAAWESRVTSTETAIGTAPYMAPETLRGQSADACSDVYSLGVVLYEALTGTFPFSADSAPAILFAALNTDPASPRDKRPDISEALEAVVLRAIAREPQKRYANATAFREALRAIEPESALQSSSRPEAPRKRLEPAGPYERNGAGRPDPFYLAVLPFRAAGDDRECGAVAERLTESVSCALGGTSGVRVIRAPLATSPGPAPESDAIARDLGANALLEARVDRSGSQLRVSYAVLDPWSRTQIMSGTVDGSAAHPFDLEDALLASLSQNLGAPTDGAAASRSPDPAAGDRYAQALGYLRRYENEASVDGAIRLMEQLIAGDSNDARYHAACARAYLHKANLTQQRLWENRAAAACERARTLAADAPEVRLALGDLHVRAGAFADARRDYEDALARRPDLVEAKLGLARVHAEAGRFDEAERACLEALGDNDDDWRTHSVLSWVYFRSGKASRARGPATRVVELLPDSSVGWLKLGNACFRLDAFEDAIAAYRRSLAIQPGDGAYSNLGTALFFLGRYDDAVAAMRRATELAPGNPARWGNLGNACHFVPGAEVEAREALDRAVALMSERLDRNPAVSDDWARLAGWHANRDRPAEACAALDRAIALAPDDLRVLVHAGKIQFQFGRVADALQSFRRAIAGGTAVGELARSPTLAEFRDDPEFAALLASADAQASPGVTPIRVRDSARGADSNADDPPQRHGAGLS